MCVRVNVHVYMYVSMSGMCVFCAVSESMHTCVCTYCNNGCAAFVYFPVCSVCVSVSAVYE